VEAADFVEPQQAPQIGELPVHGTAEALFERNADLSGKASLTQSGGEERVEQIGVVPGPERRADEQARGK
jgi:hypothetical protein